MINTKSKIIIIGLIFIVAIITFFGWYFLREIPEKPSNNEGREIAVLNQVFKNSIIISQANWSQYKIEGDNKVEYSIVDGSLVKEKIINIKLLNADLNQNNKEEIIALISLTFLGDVCSVCRDRFYIDVLDIEEEKYTIKNEQEFKSDDNDLFHSDITIEEAKLIDVNKDGIKEVQITFKADSYSGLDKIKVAIFQWQNEEFRIIWQQVTHFNMDNYSMFQEEDKYNYDSTFTFDSSNGKYFDIIVEKIILKEKGIELITPRKEQLIYKWDTEKKEYYLWKEEKIGEEKP